MKTNTLLSSTSSARKLYKVSVQLSGTFSTPQVFEIMTPRFFNRKSFTSKVVDVFLTRQQKLEPWFEKIVACRPSGLSNKQWCVENQISLVLFITGKTVEKHSLLVSLKLKNRKLLQKDFLSFNSL